MEKKLPPEAFDYYYALGHGRSYQAVADHFAVAKQTVTRRAAQDGWQSRVEELDEKARKRREEKLLENAEEMSERHMKIARAIQAKAIETLRQMPLTSAMEAVRAAESSIKIERLIRGEPNERAAISIEQVLRDEHQRWIATDEPDYDELPEPAQDDYETDDSAARHDDEGTDAQ